MRKLTALFALLLAVVTANEADAAYRRMFQDVKFPTQKIAEFQEIDNPAAADADVIENDAAGGTSAAAATLLAASLDSQPLTPRNIVITPGGTTTDVESCVIVVAGTDFFDDAISENFTFAANANTATTGAKAFKSITSVTFPADCESGAFGATWDIGTGEKLGLKRCLSNAGFWLHSSVGGVKETTVATVVADEDEVSKNTADFNGTMDGAADFDAFFFQSYHPSCQP